MNKKEKILIIHNYYQFAGGEDTVVANEKKLLEDNGHEVILYSRSNSELKSMNLLKKFFLPFSTIFNTKSYRDVVRIIQNEKIDIVHVHNTLMLISPSIFYAARKCKKPIVQTIHNFRMVCPAATFYRDGEICEDCVKYGMRCAVKHGCYRGNRLQTLLCVINVKIHRLMGIYKYVNYICLTEFNKEKLLLQGQIKENRIFVKPNFVCANNMIIPYEKRKKQFVSVGRLEKLKGTDILLDAWKKMGTQAPKLILCGIGDLEEWVIKYIAKYKLNIDYRGFVPNDEVRCLIAESQALVICSQCYEGFPMIMAEAFSSEIPVIGSNIGNVGNLIVDNINGWKYTNNNSNELADLILYLEHLNSKDISENMCLTSFIDYTDEKNYEMLLSNYKKIIKENNMEKSVGF